MKKVTTVLWKVLGWIYFPIFMACWLLHKIARIVLAISYVGLLDFKRAKDIIKYLFTYYGK